jgi:hypothetical protein
MRPLKKCLVVLGLGLIATLLAGCPSLQVAKLDVSNGPVPHYADQFQISISGTGFRPFLTYVIGIYPKNVNGVTPRVIADLTADANGSIGPKNLVYQCTGDTSTGSQFIVTAQAYAKSSTETFGAPVLGAVADLNAPMCL